MTYPKGKTEQQVVSEKINRYNLLNFKPKSTPEEQKSMNAAMLRELLDAESLQNVLPFANFRDLKLVSDTEQHLHRNMFVHFAFIPENLETNHLKH